MGAVQLPDELQRVIEQQVAEGRAASPTAFLVEAVSRLIDDAEIETDALQQAAEAGLADIDAGHYSVVATGEDERHLHEGMMARLKARLSADG